MPSGSTEVIDLVIPVYNEGPDIIRVLDALEKHVSTPIRILICYDNDEDTTVAALDDYQGGLGIVRVRNLGRYAHGAITTGFRFSDAPAVISYMADDELNATIIDEMVSLFKRGNEIVCASRFVEGGAMIGCRWYKAALVRTVAFTLHWLGRLPVHDPTNAFRLFSRKVLESIRIESSQGFTYSLELLVKCHRLGWNIAEVPAIWIERAHGKGRFRVFEWSPAYLRWYFYVYATTYLSRAA